jgi:alkaline phosphatase D
MINRRDAIRAAAALGASLAWPSVLSLGAGTSFRERRDLYPQGVASGDPHPDSVLLWTRRPPSPEHGPVQRVIVEVASDSEFRQIVTPRTGPGTSISPRGSPGKGVPREISSSRRA